MGRMKVNADTYRALPFWSWNDRLEPERLREQIRQMKEQGIGGFFMHARGGLETPYMGEEWFEAVRVCIETAKELGMQAWAYDENGWPSGFADGRVPQKGEAFQQKRMEFREIGDLTPEDRVLGYFRRQDGRCIRQETADGADCAVILIVNRYYIDALSRECTDEFIRCVHEEYYKRFGDEFGKGLRGFFTDEPQYGRYMIPYTFALEEEFHRRYGYSALDRLALLFVDAEGAESFRYDFYCLVNDMMMHNFMEPIHDWCAAHNCELTGHMMLEDDLYSQMLATAGVMPAYEYFQFPGIDWLGRKVDSPLTPKQLDSAAMQLGKSKKLTETYACCGWNLSFDEMRWILGWQVVNGVNVLCPHLEGYTIRGLRKRDHPPGMFIQQPWYDKYHYFMDYGARMAAYMSDGEPSIDVLMLHPMRSAYLVYDTKNEGRIAELNCLFQNASSRLNGLQIEHHYGDETLMERHGAVQGGKLVIGRCAYSRVVLPEMLTISASTFALLKEFVRQGGRLYALGGRPDRLDGRESEEVRAFMVGVKTLGTDAELRAALLDADEPYLTGENAQNVHMRSSRLEDGSRMLFFTSIDRELCADTRLRLAGTCTVEEIDLLDDSAKPLPVEYAGGNTFVPLTFPKMGARMLRVRDGRQPEAEQPQTYAVPLEKTFAIANPVRNALTLDQCRYRLDGGEWQGPELTIHLQRLLLELRRPCEVELEFAFDADSALAEQCGGLELVIETPEKYTAQMNGRALPLDPVGTYVDSSFFRVPVGAYLQAGRNTIRLKTHFQQPQKVYDILFTPNVHESETNKLTYDAEIESIYLLGDFFVRCDSPVEYLPRRAMRVQAPFTLVPPKREVDASRLTEEGLWFFAGELELKQTVNIDPPAGKRCVLAFEAVHMPVAEVLVNGQHAGTLAYAPFTVDITPYVHAGDNEIVLQCFTSCRNLLGPHHYPEESYSIGPPTFGDCARTDEVRSRFIFVQFGFVW